MPSPTWTAIRDRELELRFGRWIVRAWQVPDPGTTALYWHARFEASPFELPVRYRLLPDIQRSVVHVARMEAFASLADLGIELNLPPLTPG